MRPVPGRLSRRRLCKQARVCPAPTGQPSRRGNVVNSLAKSIAHKDLKITEMQRSQASPALGVCVLRTRGVTLPSS